MANHHHHVFGKKVAALVLAFATLVIIVGCTTAPVQQMSDARQRIEVAVKSGAEQYAADDLKQSRDLLAKAQLAIDTKDFEQAREIALQAQQAADRAKKLADGAQMK